MKLNIQVVSGARKVLVEKLDEITYKVKVDAPAHEGQANRRLREILAKYFKVRRGDVNIIAGERSKVKIIEIINNKI
ncbi:MAG: hypothetical protein A3F94_00125 [Candidatus Spechtbacteria bacterium RIFCSPLOWO2_12_FULL_38_22]|uniref:Uncharacterized protein n=1 Tax=Candidatus Spechtbacteria bacterium RIFCSPLOWO2_12_FULL_38_22 TaxID=1802165 RepID=A0A1G2HGL1_9BACT|nr:MAG: hypothetical protein A2728_02450 [Candidatus Spechtbacteria bacterium RIFCSPHIGHO2_01_FULL_38_11]OGZ59208.1 MAG: hypothetical protein A3E58_00125 [Candidatus Spechtbacteria bacterium RIFCSPHIGHO2_12_FULL_38_30]OGZ59987.1 MAG: hypothetical protein A3A00_01305 [Candidatus Spechtbacteria bacterium RIFCSPLOWO2_01_FULL_38_20]OGZ61627.1 MAG: hypothetical protein A3F94_00125 [Candidatus Spechtbacteria bacterium RIFCSPLOWO2_12_FULL_38_22]